MMPAMETPYPRSNQVLTRKVELTSSWASPHSVIRTILFRSWATVGVLGEILPIDCERNQYLPSAQSRL